MKYYFRDLLTLLISLFILSGCENPSKVGLDVNPDDQIQGALIDDLPISAVTVKESSTSTKGSYQHPLGYLKDPTIGESSASIQLALNEVAASDSRIPANAIIDSAIMVFDYGVDFFGDSLNSTTTVEVKQLSAPFDFNKDYPSDEAWAVEAEIFGSKTLNKFAYRDSIRIHTIISSKDTVIKVGPQLRIPLDANKIKKLFDGNLDSATFANNTFFQNRIKGFQVSINKSAQTGIGGIVHLAINSNQNGLMVYYKLPGSTDQKIKSYSVSAQNAVSSLSNEYSTAVTDQLANPEGNFETVYVQSPAGLRTKLSLPTLSSLKDQNLIINKAELIIYTDTDATGTAFTKQAPRLTLYREDIAGQRVPLPDGDTRTVTLSTGETRNVRDPRSFGLAFGGVYDKDKKSYTFILTSYIQDILKSKINNSTFYVAPASNVEKTIVPYELNVYSGYRAILGGNSNEAHKMKLNIYYTKAK
ncbi:DUF4270 family protein [Albibacterium sp.]|uniref:DUF4270 family protein n=1 Tax=Albibacterium sp. TaxID=2952885 RepID=UPI002C0421D9|nr:DUF4270 family protein [Albibacterium sp.]HUH20101.1 DUF4270 family protein [Albibacterium sp.]